MRANLIAALIGMLCVVGCGGGGGGGTTNTSDPNVQAVAVDSGPSGIAGTSNPAVNTLYTTITVCVPGTSTCQQIDHIQVDTGSSGLRIISTVLTLSLPLKEDSNGNAIAECVHFVDGSSWGPLRQADIKIAGESASKYRTADQPASKRAGRHTSPVRATAPARTAPCPSHCSSPIR